MRITFLAHSGFLIELPSVTLLFDWWKGTLPTLPAAPLYCFASHAHPDHFDPQIFSLDDGVRDVTFVLAKDIRLSRHNREKWGLSDATAEKCLRVGGNERLQLTGLAVETLPSTDEGVAFLVTADGTTIYHAGDLNWWHWEGEDKAWNRNMEVNFMRYLEPLRGRHIDLAMAPLDSRLESAADWGFRYLLELADIDRVLPMHQWEDFTVTAPFCMENPSLAPKVVPVERNGQIFCF
jgi:L-ascorbate metabolism protein UlaG (beta-lactamase superfamily)